MSARTKASLDHKGSVASSSGRALLTAAVSLMFASCATTSSDSAWPLEGTYWKLDALQGASIKPSIREAHLVLQRASARAAGFSGCNRFTSSYEMQGPAIRFKPGAATRMACREGMDTEQAFSKALDATSSWRIEGGRLQLLSADRVVLAQFTSGSERFACDNGQAVLAHYDNSDPQRPEALVSFDGQVFQMRSAQTASGARYVIERGRTPDMSLEWRTKGDEGMLLEAPLSDTRQPSDVKAVARCARK